MKKEMFYLKSMIFAKNSKVTNFCHQGSYLILHSVEYKTQKINDLSLMNIIPLSPNNR